MGGFSPTQTSTTSTPITETAKTSASSIPAVVAYPKPDFQGTPVAYRETDTIIKPTVPIKSLKIPAGVRVEIQMAGFDVPFFKDGPDTISSISGSVAWIKITRISNSNLQAVQNEGIWLLLFLLIILLILLVFLFKRPSSSVS